MPNGPQNQRAAHFPRYSQPTLSLNFFTQHFLYRKQMNAGRMAARPTSTRLESFIPTTLQQLRHAERLDWWELEVHRNRK